MPTVNEVIKRLKMLRLDEHIAAPIWCEADVLGRAKELDIKLNIARAQEILDEMDRKHDCDLGISWDTIDCYLQDLK